MEGKSVNFLQKQIEELKRERELLIGIIASGGDCDFCVHGGKENVPPCIAKDRDAEVNCEMCELECHCKGCRCGSKFEWNGKGVEDAN